MFIEPPGKLNVLYFKNMTYFIINNKYFFERKTTQITRLRESL